MALPSLIISIGRWAGATLLGGVILWQVVDHCGPSKGTAIIHVATFPVDLTVDETTYPVESIWMTPLVCELRPGRHAVRMLQDGRVLCEEQFLLEAGEEVILAVWARENLGRTPAETGQESAASGPKGAHSHRERDRREKTGSF